MRKILLNWEIHIKMDYYYIIIIINFLISLLFFFTFVFIYRQYRYINNYNNNESVYRMNVSHHFIIFAQLVFF